MAEEDFGWVSIPSADRELAMEYRKALDCLERAEEILKVARRLLASAICYAGGGCLSAQLLVRMMYSAACGLKKAILLGMTAEHAEEYRRIYAEERAKAEVDHPRPLFW